MTLISLQKNQRAISRRRSGFTLIEILVVIAIIGLLAGLVVSMAPAAADKKIRNRAKAVISELELAIGSYEAAMGFLPPDNPGTPDSPPLYYELKGTTLNSSDEFVTSDGQSLGVAEIQNAFGNANKGFANSDGQDFHKNLNPKNVKADGSGIRYLVIPVPGPDGDFNPVRYNASSPDRVNLDSYDLWVEIKIGDKLVKIGNWK